MSASFTELLSTPFIAAKKSAMAVILSGCAVVPNPRAYSVVENIAYTAHPTERQFGDLYLPEGNGPHATVLVIHGGGWTGGERSDMNKFAKRLAQAGFAAFNVGYRLAPEFRFPAQLDDMRSAQDWLNAHASEYGLNMNKFATLGYSAGAHLALMTGLEGDSAQKQQVKAIVAGGNPADLSVYTESPYIFALIGGPPSEFPQEYTFASPVSHVNAGDPPAYLYHGKWDKLLEVDQSRKLRDAFVSAKVDVTLKEQAGSGHITTFLFDADTMKNAVAFLKEKLEIR